MNLTVVLGALELGGIFAIMSLGLYVSYKILNLPDLTVDGSFTLGCAVSAVFTVHSMPYVGLIGAFVAGVIAGCITGLLITKLNIMPLLSGILTMTALYSINLRIMGGRANLPLTTANTLFNDLSQSLNVNKYYITFVIAVLFTVSIIAILYWFFGTEIGSDLRATGNSEQMAKSLGINADMMKLLGLMISNGLVGLSGALNALYGQATDVRIGTGAIVIALASIVIGEVIISGKKGNFALKLASIAIGSIIYRIIYAFVLQLGLNTDDLKILTAMLVAVALTIPVILNKQKQLSMYKKLTGRENNDA